MFEKPNENCKRNVESHLILERRLKERREIGACVRDLTAHGMENSNKIYKKQERHVHHRRFYFIYLSRVKN